MNKWKEWAKEKPESMLTVITHHNGKIGTDWVDNEMVRESQFHPGCTCQNHLRLVTFGPETGCFGSHLW